MSTSSDDITTWAPNDEIKSSSYPAARATASGRVAMGVMGPAGVPTSGGANGKAAKRAQTKTAEAGGGGTGGGGKQKTGGRERETSRTQAGKNIQAKKHPNGAGRNAAKFDAARRGFRMKAFGLAVCVAAVSMLAVFAARSRSPISTDVQTYVSTYKVVQTFPHDGNSFTQGLVFDSTGVLYESVGGFNGASAVAAIDVSSGARLRATPNPNHVFAEGIAALNDTLVQLSWQNNLLFEYSLPDLKLRRSLTVSLGREGWGLATDGATLFVTDSTDVLIHADTRDYQVLRKLVITDARLDDKRIFGVNELEWVRGELWGNVYPMYQGKYSECVARIDPLSGRVLGWIDFRGLFALQRAEVRASPMNYVLNGIAYDEPSDRLLITGKNWDKLYQVQIEPQPDLGADHIRSVCNLG